MTSQRRLAIWLMESLPGLLPVARRQWALAMRNEFAYLDQDSEALGWAVGCFIASLRDRLSAVRIPDGMPIRVFIAGILLLFVVNDVFATAATAAYYLGGGGLLNGMQGAVPGDDITRLIPLMEGIPWWVHAMWVGAATLYLFTAAELLVLRRVSPIPVLLAIGVELAVQALQKPIIAEIGVAANPNPSMLLTILSVALPLAVAAMLWAMRPSSPPRAV